MFFEQKVDLRSRAAMMAFLKGHYRYDTMSSWNRSTSYAHCIKLQKLGLTNDQYSEAFDMLGMEEVSDMMQDVIRDFTDEHNGYYTMGTNGRSGGYLVLYNSCYESTGHKSRCRSCSQLNFKQVYTGEREGAKGVIAKSMLSSSGAWTTATYQQVPEIAALGLLDNEVTQLVNELRKQCDGATLDNTCGRCHATGSRGRVNLENSPRRLQVWAGRSIDEDVDWDELGMSSLREKVQLVQSFDRACDRIREGFLDLLGGYDVVEEVVMVPTTVRVLHERHAGA